MSPHPWTCEACGVEGALDDARGITRGRPCPCGAYRWRRLFPAGNAQGRVQEIGIMTIEELLAMGKEPHALVPRVPYPVRRGAS